MGQKVEKIGIKDCQDWLANMFAESAVVSTDIHIHRGHMLHKRFIERVIVCLGYDPEEKLLIGRVVNNSISREHVRSSRSWLVLEFGNGLLKRRVQIGRCSDLV